MYSLFCRLVLFGSKFSCSLVVLVRLGVGSFPGRERERTAVAFVRSPFLPLTHPMSSGGQTCPPPPALPPPLSLSLSTKMPTKFSPSKGMTMFALPPLFLSLSFRSRHLAFTARAAIDKNLAAAEEDDRQTRCHSMAPFLRRKSTC